MEREYYSYLLRLWKAGTLEHPEWRASLEDPHTHGIQGFRNLEELYEYLERLSQGFEEINPFSISPHAS